MSTTCQMNLKQGSVIIPKKEKEVDPAELTRPSWFRDSSAQNHFGPGLLGPNPFFYWDSSAGTPRPSCKNNFICGFICGKQWKTNVYLVCFYFNIRFSTIGKRNVKKEIIFSYKQMLFLFHVGHLGLGHFGPSLQQLIFSS